MDEIAKHDIRTFPREDPKIMEKRVKEHKKQQDEAVKKNKEARRVSKAKTTQKIVFTDSERERVIICRKLSQYYDKLAHKISVNKPRTWPSDMKKLRELLLAVETDLAANGGIEQAGALYISAVQVAEKVAPLVPYLDLKMSGPQASLTNTVLANREMWNDLVTEVAIAHSEWFMVGPVKRLVMATAQMAMQVHQANTAAEKMMQGRQQPSEELKREADDL